MKLRRSAAEEQERWTRVWRVIASIMACSALAGCTDARGPTHRVAQKPPLEAATEQRSVPAVASTEPTTKNPSPGESRERSPLEAAAFFWFSSRTIGSAGHSNYAEPAYKALLRGIAQTDNASPQGWCVMFDGDALTAIDGLGDFRGYLRSQDRSMVDQQVTLKDDIWYVIAVLGTPASGWEAVDAALRTSGELGYMGMTAPREAEVKAEVKREAFLEACRGLSLMVAARIDGRRFKRINFGLLDDSTLKALGFIPVVTDE